jgi:RNA polymerase sigma factor for flagellar operon FliA
MTADRREDLVLDHLPQVRFVAQAIRRRLPPCVPLEDLVHSGVVGLLEAVDKFNPKRHVQLKTYATFRIRGAILDSLRQMDWGPRALRSQGRRLEEARVRTQSRLGRIASQSELAAEMGLSLRRFYTLVQDLHGLELTSAESEDLASQESFSLNFERRQRLAQAVDQLPESERRTLGLYYFQELTMTEVGRRLGVGESRVSQIHSSALAHMRTLLGNAQ